MPLSPKKSTKTSENFFSTRIKHTDALEIHFINMVKWRRLGQKDIVNDPLHRWLAYFDKTSPPKLITEVTNMDSAIKVANDRQVYVSGDEEAIRAYEMRELAQMDWDNSIYYARSEGIKEGIEKGMEKGEKKGEQEEKIKIARNALAKGYSPEQVCDITGLDPQAIEKLR